MILRKCDKLYEDYSMASSIDSRPYGIATIIWDNYTTVHDTYDLCTECAHDFLDFLKGAPTYGT